MLAKALAPLTVGGLLLLSSSAISFVTSRPNEAPASAPETLVSPIQAEVAPPEREVGPAPRRAKGKRVGISKGPIYVPSDITPHDGQYDLVIHFHGVAETVEPRFDDAGINAVLYTINIGNGSGPYEALFADRAAFGRMLSEIENALGKRVPALAGARLGRVALSGWSAGYGAVVHAIAFPNVADRVDAVLLSDGMHTGFAPGTRRANPLGMAPYVRFGERAVAGEKLMAVTHSQIETPTYASTTRTARALADSLALTRLEAAPATNPKFVMTDREERGDMHVFGYAGGDKSAHCQQLYNIAGSLFSFLHDRWQAPKSPTEPSARVAVADARLERRMSPGLVRKPCSSHATDGEENQDVGEVGRKRRMMRRKKGN
jgi:hypothetical protein